ncbi:HIRAN domain-containing protein [Thermodesulfitimonas sp.]
MLALLKDVARLGYLEEWPDDGGTNLIVLLRGIQHLQQGALWAGIRDLEAVGRWHALAAKLLAKYVPEEVLLNATAELYHNAFKRDKRLLLVFGAILGPAALTVPDYFVTAPRFVTRVVGLRHGTRLAEAAELAPGMPVYLVREPENLHDPNAVAVLAPWGAPLGYLHRPLAAALTARCERGESFAACVVTLCGEAYDPNERLHIEVRRDASASTIRILSRTPAAAEL